MLGVRLDDELEQRLTALSEKTNRTKSYHAKEAIKVYLEEKEKIAARNAETLARWEAYKTTGETVENESVMKWLDSWGTDSEESCPLDK
ncbi:MAG: ribbon-helix-helix protein, CopG family [Pseudomonadales bacterium]|nr:ribbon-helix-helix protein, CopG family [Pseudomonadales bacterium]